jgi:predicted Zn-dependent protease
VSCTNKNLATLLPEKRGSNSLLLSQKYYFLIICRQKDFLDALSAIYNGVISGGQYYDQNFPRFGRFSYIKTDVMIRFSQNLQYIFIGDQRRQFFCRQKFGENILKIITAWAKLFKGKR